VIDNDLTKILQWPGYRVYRHEIDKPGQRLRLWVRRKRGNRKLVYSGCGRKFEDYHHFSEREVRDLAWSSLLTTVVIEVHRVKFPDCGVTAKRVPLLPSNTPFSERFEDAVGQACESASARQVDRRFRLAESTVGAIDLRYSERWSARRTKPAVKQLGVDEIYLGKRQKFITVVSNLETAEPLWFGLDRKQATLGGYFEEETTPEERSGLVAACVDMWEPLTRSILSWALVC